MTLCSKCHNYTKDTEWVQCKGCSRYIPKGSIADLEWDRQCDDCMAGVSLEEQYQAEVQYYEYMEERGIKPNILCQCQCEVKA